LPDLQLDPRATHLKITAADGYDEVLELALARADERVMLTWAWDGVPLLPEHGFPLRIYIPGRYGMKQPKWIVGLEALDHWEAGYWVRRGWDRDAIMKSTSVIDAIDVRGARAAEGGGLIVPVGGIAHAGARGVSKVELQVDSGPWLAAQLRPPLSPTTWVLWRADVPLSAGRHNLTVRCYDGTGALQPEVRAPPHPSGASGWYSRSADVRARIS
jgi:DMSO/TMAO reductase YedYZ molybdopterin-dependent catalytic subunit